MNLARNLESSAAFFPERPAIRQGEEVWSYARLNETANRVATGLMRIGIQPGQHVALCLPNSAEWIAIYFGVMKTGAVAVTLSSLLTGDELRNLVNHSKPRFIFTSENKLKDLEPLRDPEMIEKIICPGGDLDLN